MPYPSGSYINQIQDPAVRSELEQFYSLQQGWESKQHKDDGSHSAITADSVISSGPISGTTGTFSGNVVVGTSSSAANATVWGLLSVADVVSISKRFRLGTPHDVAVAHLASSWGGGDLEFSNILRVTTADGGGVSNEIDGALEPFSPSGPSNIYFVLSAISTNFSVINQSPAASIGQQFVCPNTVDMVVKPGEGFIMIHDGGFWRIVGHA